MQALSNVIAVLAGLVGFLTALLTLYAKYLDIKKSTAREGEAPSSVSVAPPQVVAPASAAYFAPPPPLYLDPAPIANVLQRSRDAVKAPATTLLIAGLLGICFNLFIAGFGYVDQFVTPLTTETKMKRDYMDAVRRNEAPPFPPRTSGSDSSLSDEATVMLTIVTMCSLSIACAAAAWAGYGMLRLKSYWLSVAGSFAIMLGGLFFCMAGIPIGIWSLSVLYKPEVAASFR